MTDSAGVEQRRGPWWRTSAFWSLATVLSGWSLFWWAIVDSRVVDVDRAWRIVCWLGGLALLVLASRRTPVRWYDPFDSWGSRAGDRNPYRDHPTDHAKRLLVIGSLLVGVVGPWLLTSLTDSLAVHFALSVHDHVRRTAPPGERGSVTRLGDAARELGGDAETVRIADDGTASVTVWDRPPTGTDDPDVPPPPNPGHPACIEIRGDGTARVLDGACQE